MSYLTLEKHPDSARFLSGINRFHQLLVIDFWSIDLGGYREALHLKRRKCGKKRLGNPNCVTCYLDGTEHGCAFVSHLIDVGAARPCPNNDCGPRTATVIITYTSGRRETHTGLIDPFALPAGFNHAWPGTAAGRAATAFNVGLLLTNFSTAVAASVGVALAYDSLDRSGYLGASYFADPQESEPCTGSIPEAAGRAILAAAASTHVDPTLLSVTWRHESSFNEMPFPNPRYKGGKLVGYDVGPLQLSTNYYDKSPYTNDLPKAFTGASFTFTNFFPPKSPDISYFNVDVRFNGDTSQNLLAGGRAFALDILPRSNSLADAAGLYRAGSRTGQGYQDRFDQYTKEAPGDRIYLNCLAGKK